MTNPDSLEALEAEFAAKRAELERRLFIAERLAIPSHRITVFGNKLADEKAWITYECEKWSEVAAIMETYAPLLVKFHDVKARYRSQVPVPLLTEEQRAGEFMGEYDAKIRISARCPDYMSASNIANIEFFTDIPEIGICKICFNVDAAYYAKLPCPVELHAKFFINGHEQRSRGRHATSAWTSERAPIGCDGFVAYATGADRPGMARNDVHMFLCLSTVIEMAKGFAERFEKREG